MNKYFLLSLFLCISCSLNNENDPVYVAKNFKTLQYINFESTLPMLHPDSNFSLYKKYDTKKDLSHLAEYKKNFKFKVINKKQINDEEILVELKVTKPQYSKIFKPFMAKNKKSVEEILNKDKLPSETIISKIRLKKHNKEWKILFKPTKRKK